jgi:pSer/pThr/pTyr-binding forkhead associated (FHA) protein
MSSGESSDRVSGTEPLQAGSTVESAECLRCSAPVRWDDLFCEACGTDQSAAAPWTVEIIADRAVFERLGTPDVVFPAGRAATRFEFLADQVAIGRTSAFRNSFPDIDLSGGLADPGVSHHHALIRRTDRNRFELVDLGSTNGTTINDGRDPIRPHTPVAVGAGDRIRLGAWTTIVLGPQKISGTS